MLLNKDLTNLSSFKRRSQSYTLTTSFPLQPQNHPTQVATFGVRGLCLLSSKPYKQTHNKIYWSESKSYFADPHNPSSPKQRSLCSRGLLWFYKFVFETSLFKVPLYRCCTSPRSSCALEAERLSLKTPYVGCRQALRDTGCPLGTTHKRCPLGRTGDTRNALRSDLCKWWCKVFYVPRHFHALKKLVLVQNLNDEYCFSSLHWAGLHAQQNILYIPVVTAMCKCPNSDYLSLILLLHLILHSQLFVLFGYGREVLLF